jgi:hypothetical protein
VRDSMRNHPGFAASGARKQQKRPFHVLNGLALARVEALQEIHGELSF